MRQFFGLLTQLGAPRSPRAAARPVGTPPPAPATGSPVDDDKVLTTLKAASDRIAEKIHSLYMARESVIALVSTVAGGVFA